MFGSFGAAWGAGIDRGDVLGVALGGVVEKSGAELGLSALGGLALRVEEILGESGEERVHCKRWVELMLVGAAVDHRGWSIV